MVFGKYRKWAKLQPKSHSCRDPSRSCISWCLLCSGLLSASQTSAFHSVILSWAHHRPTTHPHSVIARLEPVLEDPLEFATPDRAISVCDLTVWLGEGVEGAGFDRMDLGVCELFFFTVWNYYTDVTKGSSFIMLSLLPFDIWSFLSLTVAIFNLISFNSERRPQPFRSCQTECAGRTRLRNSNVS